MTGAVRWALVSHGRARTDAVTGDARSAPTHPQHAAIATSCATLIDDEVREDLVGDLELVTRANLLDPGRSKPYPQRAR